MVMLMQETPCFSISMNTIPLALNLIHLMTHGTGDQIYTTFTGVLLNPDDAGTNLTAIYNI